MKKKVKRFQGGGLSGIADTANELMGEVDGMANTINYGTSTATGSSEPVGFSAIAGMKKGGKVKSASVRADGIATKGKTRGKVV
jgi:hypothetical protein